MFIFYLVNHAMDARIHSFPGARKIHPLDTSPQICHDLCRYVMAFPERIIPMDDKALNTNPATDTLIKAGEAIPGYDIRKGLAAVDGDTEAWREVTQIFIDTTPGILETLKAQCEEDDPQYSVTVHGIKGVCYSVGAEEAGDKAKELELRSKDGDTAFVRAHTGNLVSTVEKLIVDLTNLLKKIPADR